MDFLFHSGTVLYQNCIYSRLYIQCYRCFKDFNFESCSRSNSNLLTIFFHNRNNPQKIYSSKIFFRRKSFAVHRIKVSEGKISLRRKLCFSNFVPSYIPFNTDPFPAAKIWFFHRQKIVLHAHRNPRNRNCNFCSAQYLFFKASGKNQRQN